MYFILPQKKGFWKFLTGEIIKFDGEDFIVAAFGTYIEGKFIPDIISAITLDREQIIQYNFSTDQWDYLKKG